MYTIRRNKTHPATVSRAFFELLKAGLEIVKFNEMSISSEDVKSAKTEHLVSDE